MNKNYMSGTFVGTMLNGMQRHLIKNVQYYVENYNTAFNFYEIDSEHIFLVVRDSLDIRENSTENQKNYVKEFFDPENILQINKTEEEELSSICSIFLLNLTLKKYEFGRWF